MKKIFLLWCVSVSAFAGLTLLTPLKTAINTAFDPNTVPNLARDFDPRSGVTKNGSNQVTSWLDQTSNADTATPYPATANAFVYTSNQFGGTLPGLVAATADTDIMVLTAPLTGLTSYTYFFVYKPTTVPANNYFLGGTSAGNTLNSFYTSGFFQVYDGGAGSYKSQTYASLSPGTAYLIEFQSGAGPGTSVLTVNGVVAPYNSGGGSGGTSWSSSFTYIGGNVQRIRTADGAFGRILFYTRSINNTESNYISSGLHTEGWY